MNRKEFEIIADVLYAQREMIGTHITEMGYRAIIRDFSGALANQNQRFNRDLFAHRAGWCNEYNAICLPNEEGKCSLCDKYEV